MFHYCNSVQGDSGGASVSLYRVNNTKGITCILIRTDGILDIKYRTSTGEDVVANTFMPDETDLSGDCSDDNVQSLTMIFKGFTLFMLFKKTPGGERWYVSTIDLAYSSSNPLLKQIDRPNLEVSVASLCILIVFFHFLFRFVFQKCFVI